MLEDYAFLIWGLISLYEATFERAYLARAASLARAMADAFEDAQHGGFFMTAAPTGPGVRAQEVYDGAIPSGNSAAAFVLVKLHQLSGEETFKHQAEGVFRRFGNAVGRAPQAHTFFLSALDAHLNPPVEITVYADLNRDQTIIANIRKVVYKHFIPGKVLKHVPSDGAWHCVVCRDGACLPKAADVGSLEKLLQ